MAEKFHINEMGNPGRCSATKGSCPFGEASDHFDTPQEARASFEKAKTDELFVPLRKVLPETKTKSEIPLKELSSLAKTSSDVEILTEAAERGSARTLGNLVSNRAAPSEVLVKAFERADDDALRLRLQSHDNFPIGSMNEAGLTKLYHKHPLNFGRRMTDDSITDAQGEVVMQKYAYYGAHGILTNPNNKLSQEFIVNHAEADLTNFRAVVNDNPKYPLKDRIPHLSGELLAEAIKKTGDEDAIRKIYRSATSSGTRKKIISNAALNPATPTDVLDKLGHEDRDHMQQMYLYYHKNASASLKKKMSSENPELAIAEKVGALLNKNPDIHNEIRASAKMRSEGFGGRTAVITLDANKIREMGLSDNQVGELVRRTWPGLADQDGSWNPETSEYRGS